VIIDLLKKSKQFKKIRVGFGLPRAEETFRRIKPFLKRSDKILEIGAGSGDIAKVLKNLDYNVAALDVQDISFWDDIRPIIYDGKKMPFSDKSFDVALLITVLHHTKDPEAILREAKRVSKKVIVIEDIFTDPFQKYLTFVMDSFINLEFINHPHSNKDDAAWREVFKRLGFRILGSEKYPFWRFFLSGLYVLES